MPLLLILLIVVIIIGSIAIDRAFIRRKGGE